MELSLILIILCMYSTSAVMYYARNEAQCIEIWIWRNFRYEGMLSHSFDRFYMVTKIEIPKGIRSQFDTVSI